MHCRQCVHACVCFSVNFLHNCPSINKMGIADGAVKEKNSQAVSIMSTDFSLEELHILCECLTKKSAGSSSNFSLSHNLLFYIALPYLMSFFPVLLYMLFNHLPIHLFMCSKFCGRLLSASFGRREDSYKYE